MSHITSHPAPGLGDLLPGWFVVPQNPIRDAHEGYTSEVKYVPHMGDLLPGMFVVPQNPLIAALKGGSGGVSGLGCGSTCANDRVALSGALVGMGDIDLSSIGSSISSTLSGISTTTWMYIGGGALLLMLLMSRPGKSQYQSAMASARDDYRRKVSSIRSKYPRVGGRIKRGAQAAYEAV